MKIQLRLEFWQKTNNSRKTLLVPNQTAASENPTEAGGIQTAYSSNLIVAY
jgi:hypothetical protein